MTLTIASILLVIVIPDQSLFLRKTEATVVSSQLLRALHLARESAMIQHTTVILCKSADQKTCSGAWRDGYIVKIGDQVLQAFTHSTPAQLYWRAFPKDQEQLVFSASGETAFENGTFWYCEKGAMKPAFAVILSQAGRARWVKPDASGQMAVSLSC
jgi:type IV fimbrial biogenesis protein FimT